jgi:hypothetical protein
MAERPENGTENKVLYDDLQLPAKINIAKLTKMSQSNVLFK